MCGKTYHIFNISMEVKTMTFSIHTFEISIYPETDGQKNWSTTKISRGIRVNDNDNGYRRQISLVVNPSKLLGGNDLNLWKPNNDNIEKLIRKLKSSIDDFFDSEISLKDFELTRCDFTINIRTNSKKKVTAYIQIMHNTGKVSGFSLKYDEDDYNDKINIDSSFDLVHSNGIELTLYDKFEQCNEEDASGILRVEVRLKKRKSLRKYTDETHVEKQITDLAKKSKEIFLDTFVRAVPPGNYYIMKQAINIIENKVSKKKQREKMLRLLKLSRNESLFSALKKLNDKNTYRILTKFADIGLSPVTLRKKYGVKELKSLYNYF